MTSANELRSGKTHRDENFPVASWLIQPRHRALILAFYNFVRTADDIADHATLDAAEKLRYLDLLEAELTGKGDSQTEAVTLRNALAERSMPPRHALDLLTAFRMDVSKLRYENWDEVIHYCRYSAMPVGRFVLDVHGESTATWPASDAICAGLRQGLRRSQPRLFAARYARGGRRVGRRVGSAAGFARAAAMPTCARRQDRAVAERGQAACLTGAGFPARHGDRRDPGLRRPHRAHVEDARSPERARASRQG